MKKFKYSEITPENIYRNRREFIKKFGLAAGSVFLSQNLNFSANAAPKKEDLKLTDYKVMILSSEKGTGAITRVFIESTDSSTSHWTTIGVSSNIIDASYNAIYDSITYKLFKDTNKS